MHEQYTQLPLAPQTKRCNKCGETKPLDAFYRNKQGRLGRQVYCKACASAYNATYYAANAETIIRQSAIYRTANADDVAATKAAYRAANKAATAALLSAWHVANLDKVREYRTRRRALIRGAAVSDFTGAQWREIKAEYGGRCAYCGDTPAFLTQDHVIPLSRGGNHTRSNIVPACISCNASKKNRLPSEWKRRSV